MLHPVGTRVSKNAKQGGGEYTVIGHVNCDRCSEVIEDREVTEPSKKHRQKGSYYLNFRWCWYCGLFKADEKSRINLKEVPSFIE